MNRTPKVLLIDKAADRKERIAALKNAGYSVYPALNIREARSRCKPGAYDFIIVNAAEDQEAALELCDHLRGRMPKQRLLLALDRAMPCPERDYLVSSEPKQLLQQVQSLLESEAPVEFASAA